MSATTTPTPAPGSNNPKTNHAGLTVLDYRGSKTTLCENRRIYPWDRSSWALRPHNFAACWLNSRISPFGSQV